jgi:hypothetical protein
MKDIVPQPRNLAGRFRGCQLEMPKMVLGVGDAVKRGDYPWYPENEC